MDIWSCGTHKQMSLVTNEVLLRMLGKSLASPLLTFDSAARSSCVTYDLVAAAPNVACLNVTSLALPSNVTQGACTSHFSLKKWAIQSTAQIDNTTLSNEDRKTWEASREALSVFDFSAEEKDKILGKAFGHVHSPYWGEQRKQEVPKFEIVSETLDYLRSLGLTEDDLYKLLKNSLKSSVVALNMN
ncbi:unnamed protein product [Dovyalis caffra]|uniref:Uncharacterized protein n=1 Tax=Dovyalis caffra TaxID=77055 RepID=A0AAV1QPC3_9ROSI|nr:unnamed protein product [Dovyalis caffra]